MAKQIKTEINCQNLAPLTKFSAEILSDTLKIAIFANNGSGKTFLSRMFRIAEKDYQFSTEENGNLRTDKLISFEKTKCDFSLKITDKEGHVIEDFYINIAKGQVPNRPNTHYIYHCFNQDFVDENIRTLSYQKDGNILGYILGKANIDVTQEKELRSIKVLELETLTEAIKSKIKTDLTNKIDSIPNIKRLSEYQSINFENLFSDMAQPFPEALKTYNDLISDYNKVKSVPENLEDIKQVEVPEILTDLLKEIQTVLETEYTLSTFSESFKEKVKSKQNFIEIGLGMITEQNCPFCEQNFNAAASKLIDQYNAFVSNAESYAIKTLNQHKESLRGILKQLKGLQTETNDRTITYNLYVGNYIPSLEGTILENLAQENILIGFTDIAKLIDQKTETLSKAIILPPEDIQKLELDMNACLETATLNNVKVVTCNQKKNGIDQENKDVRRMLCKVIFNDLFKMLKTDKEKLKSLADHIKDLDKDIREKEEQQKVSKKHKVFETVKKVLHYFFGDKYTLDEENFRLILNQKILDDGQAKDVLSEGEKNVIAFAYYIGDIHLKIDKEDDYNKLFFVIDDPISSMDFNHVYSICGIIRNLKDIINSDKERFIILTHNLDFMRVVAGNNIASKSLLLKDSKLREFNNNLTVPYISHLHDIYQVANSTRLPSHTTANSIRHVIESLNKFENIDVTTDLISKYIKANVPNESKAYTLINDLSHGGWRTEQAPIHEEDFIDVCKVIITLIEQKYKGQIDYCIKLA